MRAVLSLITLLYASSAGLAMAQGSQTQPDSQTPAEKNNQIRDQEVKAREPEDYSARGLPLGGFKLLPKVEVEQRFTDNLFYEQTNRREDMVTTITPGLQLKSQWNRNELAAHASSEIQRHNRFEQEDVENFTFGGSGRLDVTDEFLLRASGDWNFGHESRSEPDDAGGITPTETETRTALLGAEYHGPKIRSLTAVESTEFRFSAVRRADGTISDATRRNRRVDQVHQRFGYEIIPEYVAFTEVNYNRRTYEKVDAFGIRRDSHGWEALLGTELEFSGALRGEIYGSYMWQRYDSDILDDISVPGAGMSLTWTPTGLTTIKSSLARKIAETTSRFSSSTIATRAEASVAHELRRNIILEADTSFTHAAFQNIGRNDNTLVLGVTGTYKLNRNIYSALDYHYTSLSNNIETGKYHENTIFLKIGLQY